MAKKTEQEKMLEAAGVIQEEKANLPTVKTASFYAAPELIGTKATISSTHTDIFEMPQGLLLVSKGGIGRDGKSPKVRRRVMVPFANVKAYELL